MNKKISTTNALLVILIVLVLGLFVFMVTSKREAKEGENPIVQNQIEKIDQAAKDDKKIEDNTKSANAVISKCGFSINSPALNSPIYSNTPLTFSGIINNSNSQTLGCNWTMFEGQAGTAQLYYKNGNTWGTINTAKIIKVTNWMTAGPVPFTVAVNFNNSGPGFSNNTPMKVVFTEDNPSGATPETLELPLIFKSQINNVDQSLESINQDGKFIGYIKSISNLNGNYSLKIDYIEWNSCTPTAGQPESCNNGFKIINNNPLIRTFPISNTASIKTLSINGIVTPPTPVTLSAFKTLFDSTTTSWKSTIPFHITVTNGIITEILEQYIP